MILLHVSSSMPRAFAYSSGKLDISLAISSPISEKLGKMDRIKAVNTTTIAVQIAVFFLLRLSSFLNITLFIA